MDIKPNKKKAVLLRILTWTVGILTLVGLGFTIVLWNYKLSVLRILGCIVLFAAFVGLLVLRLRTVQYNALAECKLRRKTSYVTDYVLGKYLAGKLRYNEAGYEFFCYVEKSGELLCYASYRQGNSVQNIRLYDNYVSITVSEKGSPSASIARKTEKSIDYVTVSPDPSLRDILERCKREMTSA